MLYKINTEFKKYSSLESAKDILEDLVSQKSEISILDLSFNTFVPEVFAEIAKVVKELQNLKHIRLESIFDSLTFEEMTDVLKALSAALPRDLRSFELPSNAVSCNFPEEFGKFLEECPLQVLNLHNCGLGEEGLKKIALHLEKLAVKDRLTSLNLSKNRVNVICPEFCTLFSQFKNLREFVLNANTIEEKSMSRFLKSIENKNLEVLNLADNFVCGEAIEDLGNLFLKSPIKELYLQDIKVDKGDINRLLESFRGKNEDFPGSMGYSRQELTLDISCNFFGQDCIALLEELATMFKFKRLVIFDNSYESIETLRELVLSDGGVVIDEEEEEIEPLDEEILVKLKVL